MNQPIAKLDVDAGRFVGGGGGGVYEAARDESCRLEVGLYPKEERKRQKEKTVG